MVLSWVSQQIWEWWGRAVLASVFTQHNLLSAASSLYWLVLKPKNCSFSSHVPFVKASPTDGTSTAVLWLHIQQQCCLNQLVPTLLHSQLLFHFLPGALPTASMFVLLCAEPGQGSDHSQKNSLQIYFFPAGRSSSGWFLGWLHKHFGWHKGGKRMGVEIRNFAMRAPPKWMWLSLPTLNVAEENVAEPPLHSQLVWADLARKITY